MEIVEKLPLRVDVQALVNTLENHVKKVGPVVFQGSEFGFNNFGGWNLQSRSGDYRDGFQWGIEYCYNKNGTFNYQMAKFLEYSHPFEHVNKTQACVGPIANVLDFLTEMGFYPRRMRLTLLKPHSKSIIHRDAPSSKYLARIHIPIITNKKCIHWTEHGEFHMPADGSVYMLWVNCMHQIRNDSDEDRYHIIMDAYDTKGITKNFKYDGNIKDLVNEAVFYRKNINHTYLPFWKKMMYTILRTILVNKFKLKQMYLKRNYQ